MVGAVVPMIFMQRCERSARKSFEQERGLRQRQPAAPRSTPLHHWAALYVTSCAIFVAACSLEALQTL